MHDNSTIREITPATGNNGPRFYALPLSSRRSSERKTTSEVQGVYYYYYCYYYTATTITTTTTTTTITTPTSTMLNDLPVVSRCLSFKEQKQTWDTEITRVCSSKRKEKYETSSATIQRQKQRMTPVILSKLYCQP
ncbi:hypothetical protein M0804_000463 [Polistes exclamans]|nr:hypothetical protein M0804_000463 [Polistes exclamans]